MEYSNQVNQSNATDILNDETDSIYQYEFATQGQRFLNWLIDNLLLQYGLSYLTGMAIGGLLGVIAPEFMYEISYPAPGETNWRLYVVAFLIAYSNYIIYYTLCEKLFKGFTLGKAITRTRAIREDGGELSFKDALLRSLCRCVPFEVLSGFSTLTWHDKWTNTMVVKAK